MKFRPYQEKYINNIQVNKSNLVVSPMRSGKSVILKGIIDKHHSKDKVLVLVGIRHVILQLSEYYEESQYTFILAGKEFDHSKHIHLGTFQTLQRRDIDINEYALICIDEAHMRFNTDIVKNIRKLSCTRVFFTGTPLKPNNTFLSKEFDNILEFINIPEMIEKGYLAKTNFKILGNMLSEESSMRVKQGDYLNSDIDRIINKTDLINMVYLDDSKYFWSTKHKTIMYTNSIETTNKIVSKFNSPYVRGIHSKLSNKELEEVREWFNKTPNGIIVNCRMLTIGVDIPSADTIVYLLPTKIHSLFLQSVFRASTKYGDKQATVYDYSGMLNKVNPFDNTWKKPKYSCREKCHEQYGNDPMQLYFCLESCKGEPIVVTCDGKQPSHHTENPFISNYRIISGQPCGEPYPSWEFQYRTKDAGIGLITKYQKCPCGCITAYDVKTLHQPSDMIPVYNENSNINTVTILFSRQHMKALALFDDIKKPRYKVLQFSSSEELYTEACKFFGPNQFQIISNARMPKLPNVAVNTALTAVLPLISWDTDHRNFIKKLIKFKYEHTASFFGLNPKMSYYAMKGISKENEKYVLQTLSGQGFSKGKFLKLHKQLSNS